MSYLPDFLLAELCEKHSLIDPYDPLLINPASIDLRLGNDFVNLSAEPLSYWRTEREYKSVDPPYAEPGEKFSARGVWLDQGVALLATTAERVAIPDGVIHFLEEGTTQGWCVPALVADVKLKSSAARSGLDHALAGWVDPGFGCCETEYPPGSGQIVRGSSLTLEFHAHRPIELLAGKCYVQLCVATMLAAPRRGYQQTGRYVGASALGAVESKGVK